MDTNFCFWLIVQYELFDLNLNESAECLFLEYLENYTLKQQKILSKRYILLKMGNSFIGLDVEIPGVLLESKISLSHCRTFCFPHHVFFFNSNVYCWLNYLQWFL